MNPFQVLEDWLRGTGYLYTTPVVAVTVFIYASETQPVLPSAGSGEPNQNSPIYVFGGDAYLPVLGTPGLNVAASLGASPCLDAAFGAILCTTSIQWNGSVELPGLAFTYASGWPCPGLQPSLSGVEVVGDIDFSASEDGQVVWIEFQTTVGYSDGENVFPYWCAFFFQQSAHYRGPVPRPPGRLIKPRAI